MAKQCGPATFLGTYMDIIGYADDDRALVRMNGVMNKAKWKRHPSFERTREAARYFGAASVIAAGIWKNVPRGLKWIMEGGAYGRLVGACRGLLGEDGNISDPEGLVGVELNGWSLPEIHGGVGLMRDESGGMRVGRADSDFDERGKMKDESARAGGLGAGRRRKYVMAEPFTDHEDPDFVVEHERLGTIEAFREGLAELRAMEGRPVVRRRRTWVAACEIGTVELVQGYGKKGKFFLEQRGRYWLGKAGYCSPWVVDHCTADFDESGEMRDEERGIRSSENGAVFDDPEVSGGKRKDESGLGERIRQVVRAAAASSERCEKRTGWFVVIVGTEVAEKRGRHWVRLPFCCGVRVAEVVEQDSQDSLNSQDCLQSSLPSGVHDGLSVVSFHRTSRCASQLLRSCLGRSEDSRDLQDHEQVIQDSSNSPCDLVVDGMAVEFKEVRRDVGIRLPVRGDLIRGRGLGLECWDGLGFKILNACGWIGLGP